jgi:hypothetical protein
MEDEIDPDYFKKVRKGEFLPIQPMTSSRRLYDTTPGNTTWEVYSDDSQQTLLKKTEVLGNFCFPWMWSKNYNYMTLGNFTSSGVTWPSQGPVEVEALANARTAAFDVSTWLAELHKTIGMIVRFRGNVLARARRIANTTNLADRARLRTQGIRGFSETWLEGRYGWRILAYDIAGINDAIYKLNSLTIPLVRGYAEASNEASEVVFNESGGLYRYGPAPGQIALQDNCSNTSINARRFESRTIRSGSILQASVNALSFDPLVTAWEIVPFSFIADWFVNIQHNIKAFSPFISNDLLGSWVSRSQVYGSIVEATALLPVTSGPDEYPTVNGNQTSTLTNDKVIYNRFEVEPSLSVGLKVNLDISKLLDIASILVIFRLRLFNRLRQLTRV